MSVTRGQRAVCNVRHEVPQRMCRRLLMCHDRAERDEFHLIREFLGQMLGVRCQSITEAAGAIQDAGLRVLPNPDRAPSHGHGFGRLSRCPARLDPGGEFGAAPERYDFRCGSRPAVRSRGTTGDRDSAGDAFAHVLKVVVPARNGRGRRTAIDESTCPSCNEGMTTILELRDRLTDLLMDGVRADTPCVTDMTRTLGVRDIDLRLQRMTKIGASGRYRRDTTPGRESNALMF